MSDLQKRLELALADLWPQADIAFFSGNVKIEETVYDPSPAALASLREAADLEFPGVQVVHISEDDL